MIDYRSLAFAEKFVVYILSKEPPMRQQQIIDKFGFDASNLRKILKNLIGRGIVVSCKNEYNVVVYQLSPWSLHDRIAFQFC